MTQTEKLELKELLNEMEENAKSTIEVLDILVDSSFSPSIVINRDKKILKLISTLRYAIAQRNSVINCLDQRNYHIGLDKMISNYNLILEELLKE